MMRRLGCCSRGPGNSVDFDEQERMMRYDGLENCIVNALACESDDDSYWNVKENGGGGGDDADAMKETFAKLLLGDDVTGGSKGVSSAVALSNAITTLGATVFGELWKLEPLSENSKRKWVTQMEWFVSPTNYMVELVPSAKPNGGGRMLEIMTPKPRPDIRINLPALRKLDSMLIETLDSMACNEFWYTQAQGGKRWWVPVPQVPQGGLSHSARNKLINHTRLLRQVFKAATSINQSVLLQMPVPTVVRDALPKCAKASLGDHLYKAVVTPESSWIMNIESQHSALETINRLEAALCWWREMDEAAMLVHRADAIVHHLKATFPNLPPTFLDVTKVQYGKDIGHSILEAYSRVLGNLALTILSRIEDVMREDANASANTPNTVSSSSLSTSSCFLQTTWRSDSASSSTSSSTTGACESEFKSCSNASTTCDTPDTRRQAWCACIATPPPHSP